MAKSSKSASSKNSAPPSRKKTTPKRGPRESKSFLVTVTEEALPEIQQLAERLSDRGMKVSRVRPLTGVISGSFDAAKLDELKKVQGVMDVEEELVAELPPPDSQVQ